MVSASVIWLHSASEGTNADQYYIKTGENFADYSYKHGGWTVFFKLRNADLEQNNVKGAKRFFIPRVVDVSLDEKNSSLSIPFEYRPLSASEEISYGKSNGPEESGNDKGKVKRKKGQEEILADAITAISKVAKKHADALAALMHEKRMDADGNPVSLLEHHLRTYTRANTSDFFIHKDLKGFLERELDFYLKNEVINLDDAKCITGIRIHLLPVSFIHSHLMLQDDFYKAIECLYFSGSSQVIVGAR